MITEWSTLVNQPTVDHGEKRSVTISHLGRRVGVPLLAAPHTVLVQQMKMRQMTNEWRGMTHLGCQVGVPLQQHPHAVLVHEREVGQQAQRKALHSHVLLLGG